MPRLRLPINARPIILALDQKLPFRGNKPPWGRSAPLVLFNSGRHLYADTGFPHWYEEWEPPLHFLSYRDFCGEGRCIYGVHVQHLGHKFGVLGGDALVRLHYRGSIWQVPINPCRLYFVVDCKRAVALCVLNRISVLPRQLLPMG